MAKIKKTIADLTKRQIEKSLEKNANNTTCTVIFQPKAPAALKNYSKISSK